MEITKIIPLNGHIYVEPVVKKQILVSDSGRLETFGKVIAIPQERRFDVKEGESEFYESIMGVKVGDYVAFELWDVKDLSTNDKKYYMVRVDELICKLELNDIHE